MLPHRRQRDLSETESSDSCLRHDAPLVGSRLLFGGRQMVAIRRNAVWVKEE
jgi:hypothetical protein